MLLPAIACEAEILLGIATAMLTGNNMLDLES